jgi:hypothetical protein
LRRRAIRHSRCSYLAEINRSAAIHKIRAHASRTHERDNQPFKIILVETGHSQARTGSRPNQVNIVVIDNSVRFNIVPKVRSRHWLMQLRLDLVDIRRVYDAIRRDIPDGVLPKP